MKHAFRERAGLPLNGRVSKLLGVQVLRHYQQKSWVLLTYCGVLALVRAAVEFEDNK